MLEVRIYLSVPADASRWLLSPSKPALPRVIAAVRPYVLPKLREENERAKKGGKQKGVKDTVHGEDFEVGLFLTELSTTHQILRRERVVKDKGEGKKTGATREDPVEVGDEDGEERNAVPGLAREETEEEKPNIMNIPSDNSDEDDGVEEVSAPERTHKNGVGITITNQTDDKKKLGFRTNYDGFRIYGRILCLVVKRTGIVKGKLLPGGTGQAVMESWIASTQEAGRVDD